MGERSTTAGLIKCYLGYMFMRVLSKTACADTILQSYNASAKACQYDLHASLLFEPLRPCIDELYQTDMKR